MESNIEKLFYKKSNKKYINLNVMYFVIATINYLMSITYVVALNLSILFSLSSDHILLYMRKNKTKIIVIFQTQITFE